MGRYTTTAAAAVMVVLVGIGAAGCGADDDSADSATEFDTQDADIGRESDGLDEGGDTDAPADASAEMSDAIDGPAIGGVDVAGRAIATTAGVTVVSNDIRAAADDTLAAVVRNGGQVFTADVSIGEELDDGSVDGGAFFVVKLPPDNLELLITDIGATVGRVSGRTQESTDVTDQLVDLDIRIGVERDVIERFRALLDEATVLEDIVEIERVIGQRTVELEQLLASERNLESRVELSTLTIELRYEPDAATKVDEPADGIGDAFRAGWDTFITALFAIGLVLAASAPFLAVALVLSAIAWPVIRRRRLAVGLPPPPADTDTVAGDDGATGDGGGGDITAVGSPTGAPNPPG